MRGHALDTALAEGEEGAPVLRELTQVVLDALTEGARERGGPLPCGGPEAVAAQVRRDGSLALPERGTGAVEALSSLVGAMARGAADPADPHCVGHLHCPPLAVAAAAELASAALNPSMDSWDQAPAATVIEEDVTDALAGLVYPRAPRPDALITSGGTESNLVALLLARERARAAGADTLQVVYGANAHHSVHRAAWTLGLPEPMVVECGAGRLEPAALDEALTAYTGAAPVLVVTTAGTTDEGVIDPLPELAEVAARHGAEMHVDAAYGGMLLFSDRHTRQLACLDSAVSVTLDMHKLGWQPVAAGILAVQDTRMLEHLAFEASYLNAGDDTQAGLPDLLHRSIRTTRRPDVLKIAVSLRALGRAGLGDLVDRCVSVAEEFAEAVTHHPDLRLRPGEVGISTVLFRPVAADELPSREGDELVAAVRRKLLTDGQAVLGRAWAVDESGDHRLWLKATLLNPQAGPTDLARVLKLVADAATTTRTTPRTRGEDR
ncbi:aminotransferase class V-fold PLP-dependent enzyme [Streptomyces sp. NPDC046862]|uniref:pyridoxal phosphate-dependent decarboxylase family protein n=1 Tax=Streptomyces sp. NPDC046862 TaxID=3154603 RepID=UPI003455F560